MGILKSILTWGETEKQKKRRLAKETRDQEEWERQEESRERFENELMDMRNQSMHRPTKY